LTRGKSRHLVLGINRRSNRARNEQSIIDTLITIDPGINRSCDGHNWGPPSLGNSRDIITIFGNCAFGMGDRPIIATLPPEPSMIITKPGVCLVH
jgi:hypothetical protein